MQVERDFSRRGNNCWMRAIMLSMKRQFPPPRVSQSICACQVGVGGQEREKMNSPLGWSHSELRKAGGLIGVILL